MNRIAKRIASGLVVCMIIACTTTSATVMEEKTPLIQIALLLDTSNSMDGLIEQAKAQLWKVVNDFITAKRDGKRPEFQVALYEYGNDSLSSSESWVRQVLPLTTDLDKVSEELFALRTNGGSEYCGTVIQRATGDLVWSESHDDLKTIFIAGNEPFTQGQVDFRKACPEAIAKGITVNTIYCGRYEDGVSTHWKEGATLADGAYMNIDQNRKVVHIDAPQDDELARLGAALNTTYIPYGEAGVLGKSRQMEQDANAQAVGKGSVVQRLVSKSSAYYKNVSWDLVDAVKEEAVELEDINDKDLPEEMQAMSQEEREAYVKTKLEERLKIQQKIAELNEERKKYVAAEMRKLSETGEDTLDTAMIKAVRKQAVKKNFTFE